VLIESDGGRQALVRLINYMEQRRRNRPRWVGALVDSTVPRRLICGAVDPVSGRHLAERYRELVPYPDVVVLEGVATIRSSRCTTGWWTSTRRSAAGGRPLIVCGLFAMNRVRTDSTACKARMTRPEWRTTGSWSWRDRRESANSRLMGRFQWALQTRP